MTTSRELNDLLDEVELLAEVELFANKYIADTLLLEEKLRRYLPLPVMSSNEYTILLSLLRSSREYAGAATLYIDRIRRENK